MRTGIIDLKDIYIFFFDRNSNLISKQLLLELYIRSMCITKSACHGSLPCAEQSLLGSLTGAEQSLETNCLFYEKKT